MPDERKADDRALFERLDDDGDSLLTVGEFKMSDDVAFVANLYSEVVHVIVRRDAEINKLDQLRGRRVAVGKGMSGHFAMSRLVLEHAGLDPSSVRAEFLDNTQIETEFERDDDPLDAAIVTAGLRAPILVRLLSTGSFDLLPIESRQALIAKHIQVFEYDVPRGYYRSHARIVPPADVPTVAVRAQLLARSDISDRLVSRVTGIVLDEKFIKQNGLVELFELDRSERRGYAQKKPAFAIHPGTWTFYDPEIHPPLNPDFVEAMEGMRSFLVSVFVAAFLGFRWVRKRQAWRTEHRLDRYLRSLLDIEKRQMSLDQTIGSADLHDLQTLLDEVTSFRQVALRELSAHELNEERCASCFVDMCQDLTQKIGAKISRQRLDRNFYTLALAKNDRVE